MPTYEYKCTDCNHIFEKMQNMTDASISVCPECSGKVERQITGGGGFLMKNSPSPQYEAACESCCSRGDGCDSPKRCCEE